MTVTQETINDAYNNVKRALEHTQEMYTWNILCEAEKQLKWLKKQFVDLPF